MTDVWTINKVLQWCIQYLKQHQSSNPRVDAETIIAYQLGLDRIALYTDCHRPLNSQEKNLIKSAVLRRAKGEPTSYIVGHSWFMGLKFGVNPNVLIPRSDSEVLAEEVLKRIPEDVEAHSLLDIGTGSGCLALSINHFRPKLDITAWDICPKAIEVASENARNMGWTEDLVSKHLIQKNALQQESWNGTLVDVIVSNPPYIDHKDEDLEDRVKQYEPHLALFAKDNGLEFYNAIASFSKNILKPNGFIAVEIGWKQAEQVCELFQAQGWNKLERVCDLSGIERVIVASRG